MTQMPLIQIHDVGRVELDRVEIPRPGPDDVLIEVAFCGICGSDLGYIAMGGLMGPGNPMPLGHELSGTVAEVGRNVRHVGVGDRVVVNPEGNGNLIGNSGAEGGFAPFLLVRGAAVDARCVTRIPDSLSLEEGALVEPLSVAMHAAHQGRATGDDRAVIFGAGPIGLGILLVLRYYGLSNIVVVDLSPLRRSLAEQLGATVFGGDSAELADFLIEQHGRGASLGIPGLADPPATDLFFEATGVGGVFDHATRIARKGARLVVVGVHKAPASLDMVNLLLRELQICGSMAYPTEFPEVITMLASGGVDVSPLITHRYPLSRFSAALTCARDAGAAVKVLVDCQA
jgi:2-desacetyl-2-hydroxyethyl bacteriochlorophyllide A dehydrogenase